MDEDKDMDGDKDMGGDIDREELTRQGTQQAAVVYTEWSRKLPTARLGWSKVLCCRSRYVTLDWDRWVDLVAGCLLGTTEGEPTRSCVHRGLGLSSHQPCNPSRTLFRNPSRAFFRWWSYQLLPWPVASTTAQSVVGPS